MEKQSTAVMQSGYKTALLCGLIFCGVLLFLLFGLSLLYHLEVMQPGREALYGRICLSVTALFSAWAAGKQSVRRKMLFAVLSTIELLIFTLILGVFTKANVIFNISFLYNCTALISGGLIGGILSAVKKKRRQSTKNITKCNRKK